MAPRRYAAISSSMRSGPSLCGTCMTGAWLARGRPRTSSIAQLSECLRARQKARVEVHKLLHARRASARESLKRRKETDDEGVRHQSIQGPAARSRCARTSAGGSRRAGAGEGRERQLDEKIRRGEFKQILPYRLPLILGNDLAGVVAAVGPLVRTFRPGDEVYARPDKDRIDTFAEHIAIAEADLALKPSSASMEAAASLPLGCSDRVASARGTRQRAGRAEGAHSRRCGRGRFGRDPARKAPRCDRGDDGQRVQCRLGSRLGADVTIDYRTEDFAEIVHNYDLVLDSLGGENLEKSLRVLQPGGRAIGISGLDAGFARELGANLIVRFAMTALSGGIRHKARRLGVSYHFLFMRPSGDQLKKITALVDDGAIRPVVARVVPFDQTAEALPLSNGGVRGKVVISHG